LLCKGVEWCWVVLSGVEWVLGGGEWCGVVLSGVEECWVVLSVLSCVEWWWGPKSLLLDACRPKSQNHGNVAKRFFMQVWGPRPSGRLWGFFAAPWTSWPCESSAGVRMNRSVFAARPRNFARWRERTPKKRCISAPTRLPKRPPCWARSKHQRHGVFWGANQKKVLYTKLRIERQ